MVIYKASSGTSNGTVVDPKSVFVAAIKANASAVILAHVRESQPERGFHKLTQRMQDQVMTRIDTTLLSVRYIGSLIRI